MKRTSSNEITILKVCTYVETIPDPNASVVLLRKFVLQVEMKSTHLGSDIECTQVRRSRFQFEGTARRGQGYIDINALQNLIKLYQ